MDDRAGDEVGQELGVRVSAEFATTDAAPDGADRDAAAAGYEPPWRGAQVRDPPAE